MASWSAAPAATLCANPGGTGGCFASIQAAVDAAGPFDVIDVAAGTYTESIAIGPGHILTLQGAGAGATVVDGGGVVLGTHVIAVDGNSTRLTLFGVTLRNAEAGVLTGGDVDGRPRVTLRNVEITGTRYGVFGYRGKIAIDGAYIHDNEGDGILLYSKASLQLVRSTVSRTGFTGVAGNPISIVGFNTPPVARIEDSTISGNVDGVINARARISRSTITANTGIGLGAFESRRPTIDATIVSANGTDCDGAIRSRGFNVVGTSCFASNLSGSTALDLATDDPMLGVLADNGGLTPTHAPLPGSPVLELVGRATACRRPDQRGVTRLPAPCDAGAHEAP